MADNILEQNYDSSNEAWGYYCKLYSNRIGIHNFTPGVKKRIQVSFNYVCNNGRVHLNSDEEGKIQLSGDCFFNFNPRKQEAFNKIAERQETKELLAQCAIRHYTRYNCVLLPTTGGMNNVKGNIYFSKDKVFTIHKSGRIPSSMFDRPDTFIFYIAEYFERRDKQYSLNEAGVYLQNSIFQFALNTDNFSEFYNFMSAFSSVYEFCDTFFLMDNAWTERMIECGKKPIVNEDDLANYMNLAMDYWKYRENLEGKM